MKTPIKIPDWTFKLIIPVALVIGGIAIYNFMLDIYKDKILKLKFISPDFYKLTYLGLSKSDKKKYEKKFKELYTKDFLSIGKVFVKDMETYDNNKNSPILEFLLVLPMLFDENPAQFNNTFAWITNNIKNQIGFSKLVSDCNIYASESGKQGIDIMEYFLTKGSKNFHKNLYKFLSKLPKI